MIDKTDIEMKEENKNSKNDTGLSIETLKQMGYKHPCTVRWIIEAVEQGEDLKDIRSGFIESRIASKQNGHILFFFSLSGLSRYNGEMEICMMDRKDFVFFIDRKWVPSNNGKLLRKVFEAICDGKTVEEALECLKEEETAQPQKPEKEAPAPESNDAEGEKIQIMTEWSSDVIEINSAAACDDTAKAKDSDKEEATEKRPNNWWTQPINDIEFTRIESDKAKAKQAAKSEAPCDLQCAVSFCKSIFEEKFGLYGASFCDMHPETVTDQLFMKATILVRGPLAFYKCGISLGTLETHRFLHQNRLVAMRLHRNSLQPQIHRECLQRMRIPTSHSYPCLLVASLRCEKGADYGGLWRELRIGTFSDMIYTKVRRLKSIENQYRVGGMTEEKYRKVVGDQYKDLINYGLFGVVRMTEIIDYLQLEMEDYESDEEEDDDE